MASLVRYSVITTRYMLALIFFLAGASMINLYALAQTSIVSIGLPGELLPWMILVVIAAAFSLIAGSWLHWASLAMAVLAVTSALLLPDGFADHAGAVTFFRNILIGSVLLLMVGVVAGCRRGASYVSSAARPGRINHKFQPTGVNRHA